MWFMLHTTFLYLENVVFCLLSIVIHYGLLSQLQAIIYTEFLADNRLNTYFRKQFFTWIFFYIEGWVELVEYLSSWFMPTPKLHLSCQISLIIKPKL